MIKFDQSLEPDWDEDNINHIAVHVKIPRPARQPVSIRLDPFDLAMVKRISRRKGLPHTQLMATWLHERIEREKEVTSD